MPKFDTKQEFVDLKGEVVKQNDVNGNKLSLTVGEVLANIILAPHQNKNGFRPLKAYELAQKFMSQPEVEIDESELIQIKEIVEVNEAYVPLITAQVIKMLNHAV